MVPTTDLRTYIDNGLVALSLHKLITEIHLYWVCMTVSLSGCRFLPQLARAALTKALSDANIHPPKDRALQQMESVKCEQLACVSTHITVS